MKDKETTFHNTIDNKKDSFSVDSFNENIKEMKKQSDTPLTATPLCKHGLSKETLCLMCLSENKIKNQ